MSVQWGIDTGEIYSFEKHTDEEGKQWFVINQDTWYPIENFTEEEARKDYSSEKSIQERFNSLYSTWCD